MDLCNTSKLSLLSFSISGPFEPPTTPINSSSTNSIMLPQSSQKGLGFRLSKFLSKRPEKHTLFSGSPSTSRPSKDQQRNRCEAKEKETSKTEKIFGRKENDAKGWVRLSHAGFLKISGALFALFSGSKSAHTQILKKITNALIPCWNSGARSGNFG